MVDLAEQLNRVQTDPQAGQVAPPVAPKSWWQQMGDYIGGTNLSDFGEAASRIMPLTAVLRAADDINKVQQAKPDQPALDTMKEGLAPQRFVAAQGAHLPTDIVSGGMSLYPMAVTLGNQLSNMAGGPTADLGQGAVMDAAHAVRESSTPFVDTLAGRPSTSDDLLRGPPTEMAGHLSRTIGGFVPVGVPSWLSNLARINTGSKYLDAAGNAFKNVIETVTPLAISANPTASTIAKNAAFGTGAGVLFEGASDIERQREEERREAARLSGAPPFTETPSDSNISEKQKQAQAGTASPNDFKPSPLDAPAAGADGVAKSAHDTMASGVDHAKPHLAGIIPSTGSDWGDAALLTVGSLGLFGLYRRDMAKMAADKSGATKITTSYDPANPLETTNMPSHILRQQQGTYRSSSLSEVMRQVEAEKGQTPAQIRETVREWEEKLASHQGASISVKTSTFFNEGKFMDNPNVRLTRPYNDHAVEVAQGLTKQQKEAFDIELHYSHELSNRENALRREFQTPGSLNYSPGMTLSSAPHEAIAHNLYDLTTPQLRAGIAQARLDPVVARLANEHREINRKLFQYAGQEGTLHQSDVARFLRENPNFIPSNDPKAASMLEPRPISNQAYSVNPATKVKTPLRGQFEPSGVRTIKELGDPLTLQARFAEEAFRRTDGVKMQRDFMNYLEDEAMRGSVVARDMLGRDRTNRTADYKVVRWRDRYGNVKQREVHDAAVRDAVKGLTNPTALQMTRGWMSKLTGLTESGAVGPLSLAGGQVFPIRSAAYSVTGGAVLSRPPGISMGWIDKGSRTLVEKLTGGRHSYGIPDIPTFAADALLYRAPINMVAVTAGHLGNALHNAVLKNSFVARAMTPARAQQYATALKNHYLNSALAGEIQHGLTGPSSMESMTRSNIYSDPAQAFRAQGKAALSYHYLRDVMHSISAAPAQSIRAMNKNQPEWKVNSAIRNLAGDVGRSGAFRKFGGEQGVSAGAYGTRYTPWGNTYLQSGSKTLGSFNFRENPAEASRVVGRIMSNIVAPSGMLALWAAALGPEYAKYMYNDDTAEKRASSWYVPIPGRAPNEAWRPVLEPWMRPFKLLGEMIAGHFIGAYSGELYKDENSEVQKAIAEAVFHRDFSLDKDSIPGVLLHQVLIPPVPPILTIPFGMAGAELRNYGDVKMPGPARRDAGHTEGTGKDPTGEFLGFNRKEWMDTLVQSIGATGAQTVFDYVMEGSHAVHLGAGPLETAQRVGQVMAQRTKDSLDVIGSGPLFDNARAIVPTHAGVSVLAKQKTNVMQEIANAVQATESHGVLKGDFAGGTRKITPTPLQGPGPPPAPDGETARFEAEVARMNKSLQPAKTRVNVMFSELAAIKNNYAYSPEERRARAENTAYQIINANKLILAEARRYEAILSQDYGRKITFDDYKRGVPISQQFKPLTGGVSRPGDYPTVR